MFKNLTQFNHVIRNWIKFISVLEVKECGDTMSKLNKLLAIVLAITIFSIPLSVAQDLGTENTVQPEKLWDKTYIILSLNDIKMVKDWDYIIKTLPEDHKGIMIMWYGITQNYQNDFDTVQKFINTYKKAYPDKEVIELWMTTQLPTGNNQTTNITTPILQNVDYIITFDDVTKLLPKIPKDTNIKIIASYVYEKRTVPVQTNSTNSTNSTPQTQTVINEQPSWSTIEQAKKEDPRLVGIMIYTNDNQELPNIIKKAKADGFSTYTIILPTPTLFGGVDMVTTYQKIQDAVKYYDYVLFYSWDSITPQFNYLMSGGGTTSSNISEESLSKWGKYTQWSVEIILALVIIVGISYAIIKKKKKPEEKEQEKEHKNKKNKKNKQEKKE